MAKHVIQNLDEDFMQCAICMDRYKKPVMLPCLHSFCLPCLDKSDKGIHVESFACPTCRRSVKLTSSGFRGLPSNFFLGSLLSLVERFSLIEKLSNESASKCKLCQTEGSGLFCLDCQMHSCESCEDVHSNLPGMDEHTIISADKLSDQKYIIEITAGQAPRCKKHKQEKLRLYCKTCNELLCRDCTLVDHQGHKCMEILSEFLDAKTRIRGRIERGKEQAQIAHELATDLKLSSQKIEDQAAALCKQIYEHAEKLIEKINFDKASLKTSLEESTTSKNVPLLRNQSDATKWVEAMENTNKVAERVIEGDNPWEILGMERKLHDTFDKLDSERTSFRSSKKDNPLADDVDLSYDPEITTSAHKDYAVSNPLKLPNVLGCLKSGASKERRPRHSKATAGPLGVLMSFIYFSAVVGTLFLVSTVAFVDTTPPDIACPNDIIQDIPLESCGKEVTFMEPTAEDNSARVILQSANHRPGEFFDTGNTTVEYVFADHSGNEAACHFNIVIYEVDTIPPMVECPEDVTEEIPLESSGTEVHFNEPTATDNSGFVSLQSASHRPGAFFDKGNTTVAYAYEDKSGNVADCMFNVNILQVDRFNPVVSCPGAVTRNITYGSGGTKVQFEEPAATDNSGEVALRSRSHAPGEYFENGRTSVTYAFVDSSGNTAECHFSVDIIEDIKCNYPRDCEEAIEDSACHGFFRRGTDRYLIQPGDYLEPFEAVCKDTISGAFTVIQRRSDGSTDFDRSWNDYTQGFGDPGGEFWLGNDRIHFLTNQAQYQLTIDMIATNGKAYQMSYTSFRIGDESTNYTLEEVGEMFPKDTRNRSEGILITCVNGVCDNNNLVIEPRGNGGVHRWGCDYRTPAHRYKIDVADGFAVNLTFSSFRAGDGRDLIIIDEGKTGRRTLSEREVTPFSVLSSTRDMVVEFVHTGSGQHCDCFVASVQGYHNLLDSSSVDALTNHLGKPFATGDRYTGNCSISGGWWHGAQLQFVYRGSDYCGHSNLNGEFMAYTPQGIQWLGLPHERRAIKYTEMRIKKIPDER